MTYEYFAVKRLIIPKYVHSLNSLQDIRQNHWTMKYIGHNDLHLVLSQMTGHAS